MTHRLTLGIDPGQTGAIAALADGKYAGYIDMPTIERKAGGLQIDGKKLAEQVRWLLSHHSGAYVYGVIELVAGASEADFEATLAKHPELLDKNLLERYYSPEVLKSAEARARWVAPDLKEVH